MKTRDRILDTALRLFNDSGTAAVSTNHIADALGISPGNLYYHFRNKEEIIQALFERLFALWDRVYSVPDDSVPTLQDLCRLVHDNFVVLIDYRFVYRELIVLLRRDDQLRRRWGEVRARGFAGFHELFNSFVAAGILRAPDDAATITRLAELCWLISEFWLSSVEISGQAINQAQMEHGVALMFQVLDAFIIDDVRP